MGSLTLVGAQNRTAIDTMPRAFLLGEVEEAAFETLKGQYETTLVTAARGDMEAAYYLWVHLLKHIESHAERRKFDLRGIRAWFYVFWNKEGGVDHIAYYLKPNSRNLNDSETEAMNQFLADFIKVYKSPLKYDKPYSNYNSASFPVLVENAENGGIKRD